MSKIDNNGPIFSLLMSQRGCEPDQLKKKCFSGHLLILNKKSFFCQSSANFSPKLIMFSFNLEFIVSPVKFSLKA